MIYSKNKIMIELLYTYIREYIERKRKQDDTFPIIIEGRNSIQTIETELFLENSILLLNKIKESSEGISDNNESVYIIILDNICCKMKEKLFFQEKDGVYFIYELQELIEIIETVMDKEKGQKKLSDNLTKREREILVLITKGKLNKEIANELNITERTVKNHIANLFKKINVYDRTQAAVYAIKNGIYSLYLEDLEK